MNLASILHHIRKMRDRDGLREIINTAEARDSKLGRIDSERERARLWKKLEAHGFKAGDMVFIHTAPVPKNATGQHKRLWARPLTVREVKPRSKEIVVRAPGSTVDHRLSAFSCDRLKLSHTPTPAALAAGLQGRTLQGVVTTKPAAVSQLAGNINTTRKKK